MWIQIICDVFHDDETFTNCILTVNMNATFILGRMCVCVCVCCEIIHHVGMFLCGDLILLIDKIIQTSIRID